MSFTRPYVLRISAIMATSPNQQGGVGAASGAIWMWTEACVILRGYSPFKMTFCLVDLLRRHLFLSFYNASPLLSTFFLISPAYWYLVAQLVGLPQPMHRPGGRCHFSWKTPWAVRSCTK